MRDFSLFSLMKPLGLGLVRDHAARDRVRNAPVSASDCSEPNDGCLEAAIREAKDGLRILSERRLALGLAID